MVRQLALDVGLADVASFENFYTGDQNRELVHALSHLEPGDFIFLHGDLGSGKTHLLHAALRNWTEERGSTGLFWSASVAPASCSGLICIDDVQDLAAQDPAELALFELYEVTRNAGGTLLMAGDRPPGFISWNLPDLASRLSTARIYRLARLADEDLHAALQLRAHSRGFELPEDVVTYILHRYRRDSAHLFGLLDRIDTQSLAAGRKVTLPFFRELEQRHAV